MIRKRFNERKRGRKRDIETERGGVKGHRKRKKKSGKEVEGEKGR